MAKFFKKQTQNWIFLNKVHIFFLVEKKTPYVNIIIFDLYRTLNARPSTIGKCKLFTIKHNTRLEGEIFLRNKHKIKENTIRKHYKYALFLHIWPHFYFCFIFLECFVFVFCLHNLQIKLEQVFLFVFFLRFMVSMAM